MSNDRTARGAPLFPSGSLDHVAIAVESVEAAAGVWRALLGTDLAHVEEVASEGVRVGFLALPGGGAIELLEPLGDCAVRRFLDARGPGVHHLSFRVSDCAAAVRAAEAAGIRALPPGVRPGSRGSTVAFFHPKDTGGVLIEVMQPPPS